MLDKINRDSRLYPEIVKYVTNKNFYAILKEVIPTEIENINPLVDGMDYDRKGYSERYEYDETFVSDISVLELNFSSVDVITSTTTKVTFKCIA